MRHQREATESGLKKNLDKSTASVFSTDSCSVRTFPTLRTPTLPAPAHPPQPTPPPLHNTMGVPGLWQELAAAGIDRTLSDLAWEKWKTCLSKKQGLRLGIDATLWMYHARKAKGGKNPALRSLFFRLARLLTLPITPIFVLDGADRPKVKRDAAVYTGVHVIQVQFCAMLDAFQFAHWTAPAEAEAELAWMDKEGLIDAVLTDDVDALLFGARVVVRNSAWHERDHDEDDVDKAAVYDTAQGDWSVDSDGMVLVALLAGADYDTQGMFRCGVKVRRFANIDGHRSRPRWIRCQAPCRISHVVHTHSRCTQACCGMGRVCRRVVHVHPRRACVECKWYAASASAQAGVRDAGPIFDA